MPYLARIASLPTTDDLTDEEIKSLEKHFDANAYELNIDGTPIEWGLIEEVEVVIAARQRSPSGWFLKNVVFHGERYHVGVYFGRQEAVLINQTLNLARYIVAVIAHYAQQDIRYKGIEGVAVLNDAR